MTRAFANQLLDAARAGKPVSHVAIGEALRVTGDLPPKIRIPSSRRMPNFGRTL